MYILDSKVASFLSCNCALQLTHSQTKTYLVLPQHQVTTWNNTIEQLCVSSKSN